MWTGFIVALAVVAGAGSAANSTEKAKAALSSAAGKALQGRALDAVPVLRSIEETDLNPKDRIIRQCMLDRFSPGSAAPYQPASHDFAARSVGLYRIYWWSALTSPDNRTNAEEQLTRSLRHLLELPADADWDKVEEKLRSKLSDEGYHSLMGRTPPLLEFMIWKSESSEHRYVPLPGGDYRVRMKLLDDFASLGWSAYATCGHSFTGGWVRPDAIYAVKPGWKDLADESFVISFLAHETQHFADKSKFGDLASWILEYRAKLAELALATETIPAILRRLRSNQGTNPDIPHSYANAMVLDHLRKKIGTAAAADLSNANTETIKSAARSLLIEDSRLRPPI